MGLLSLAVVFFGYFSRAAFAEAPPRILYLCSNCDQYQMAYTEDTITQAARKNKIGIIKLGNTNVSTHYAEYVRKHPGSDAGALAPLKAVKFPYDPNSFPKNDVDMAERRKQFRTAKREWSLQILNQLKRMDKTRPLVLHFGNHGFNSGRSSEESSALCMYSSVTSPSQCLTYREIGDLLTEAGLTGISAPPVRIVGDHCFSGGVHSIAMRFPNICSASNVSYKTRQWSTDESYGDEDAINTFGQTFWNTVLQEGAVTTSLAESFQSAWAVVPKGSEPGGTLSSIFYAQQIAGWSEEDLPTANKLAGFVAIEKNLNAAESLFSGAQIALGKQYTMGALSKPQAACYTSDVTPIKIEQWESVFKSLHLDSGINIYRDAANRAKHPAFLTAGKQSMENLNRCWQSAKQEYDSAEPAVKDFIEQNGNWAWKNVFRSKPAVDVDTRKFQTSQMNNYANKVLVGLRKCVAARQSAAREYLGTLQTLNTLSSLGAFAAKATKAQKDQFRKKVECESSPLL